MLTSSWRPSAVGENVVARSDAYAANLEIATSVAREPEFGPDPGAPEPFDTPGIETIAQLAEFARLDEAVLAKSVVVVDRGRSGPRNRPW